MEYNVFSVWFTNVDITVLFYVRKLFLLEEMIFNDIWTILLSGWMFGKDIKNKIYWFTEPKSVWYLVENTFLFSVIFVWLLCFFFFAGMGIIFK